MDWDVHNDIKGRKSRVYYPCMKGMGSFGPGIAMPTHALNLRQALTSSLLNNLIAYYNFETLGLDSIANANNMVNNNGVTQGTGIIGNAGFFNRSNQFFSLNKGLVTASPISISIWINPNFSTKMVVFNLGNNSESAAIGNATIGWAGTRILRFNLLGSNVVTGPVISTNVWTHVVVTYDTSGTGSMYINGSLYSSTANMGDSLSTMIYSSIGAMYLGGLGTSPFGGLIDELGVWSSVLTSAQVSSLYNGGAAVTYPFIGIP